MVNATVWSFGIVPDKVLHQFEVEIAGFIDIVKEEIDTLLLDGTVESLQETI